MDNLAQKLNSEPLEKNLSLLNTKALGVSTEPLLMHIFAFSQCSLPRNTLEDLEKGSLTRGSLRILRVT